MLHIILTALIVAPIAPVVCASPASTSSNSNDRPKTNQHFWHDLMQQNGIVGEKIGQQIGDDMDNIEPLIEEFADDANCKTPSPPLFERTYSKKFAPNTNEMNLNNEKQIEKFQRSPLSKMLSIGNNFCAFIRRIGTVANLLQSLAKTFIGIKKSKNAQIDGSKVVSKFDEAARFLAKQNGIPYDDNNNKNGTKMDVGELLKNWLTIWTTTFHRHNKNGNGGAENNGKNAEKIVFLWLSTRQNEEFTGKKKKQERKGVVVHSRRRRKRFGALLIFLVSLAAVILFAALMAYSTHSKKKNDTYYH